VGAIILIWLFSKNFKCSNPKNSEHAWKSKVQDALRVMHEEESERGSERGGGRKTERETGRGRERV
jgi:hypothetical protein